MMRAWFRPAAIVLVAWSILFSGCAPLVAATKFPSPLPTLALTATPTTNPSATVTPSPTPTLHPLTIQAMRQRDYPGSDVTIEDVLDPGANYARYLASYQSEGLRIFALLTVPNGERPADGWPVIIFNHGFIPPDEYRTTERYVAYVDSLARHGYIVFRPDYRGHGDSDGVASGAYGSPDYVVDVLNAVATMRRYPKADPERIGMWGHSMGGYITLRAMVIDHGLRAGVIWAGVVGSYPDLLTRWRRTATPGAPVPSTSGLARGWRSNLERLYGSPEENPAFYASISAQTYLADLSGPLQLHHGTGDASVPWEFSQELYEQARQAGAVVELYLYEGADHNLSAPFSQAMLRTIDFFDRYLKGYQAE
ncbi:MAG TPA: alpha/beta fold hydrolase [Anaerolineales bacterium]|nr:alpha/beta fold hydrolase [Anaerolineales bacterium]